MLFSVIIPTYNRAKLLRETIESVFAQRFTDFEIIVVDDGSTDDTKVVCRSFGDRIIFQQQENKGVGVARNLGASLARGEYLAFLDSDDLWFPWTLTYFAELIQKYNRPSILSAKLVAFAKKTEIADVSDAQLQAEFFEDYFSSHHFNYFVGAGMSVLDRTAFLDTGGYTDNLINAEDHDLILRMGDACGFVQITAPVTLAWRRHAGSATIDIKRTVAGCFYMIEQERRGAYPGGQRRNRDRWHILSNHIRPASLDYLRAGGRHEAWGLYRATFFWHLTLGKWKYLVGFLFKRWVFKIK